MSLDDALNEKKEDEVVETTENTEPAPAPVVEPDADDAVVDPQPVVDPLEAEPEPLPQLSELETLRARADQLGLKYRSNTGVEKLRALVNSAIDGTTPPVDQEDEEEEAAEVTEVTEPVTEPTPEEASELSDTPFTESPTAQDLAEPVYLDRDPPIILDQVPEVTEASAVPLTERELKVQARAEARRLVRIRLTNHNPQKSEHQGALFTFGNGVIGTLKRFVPFETEWHVENAILEMIKNAKYQHFYTIKDDNGRPTRTSKLVNEYSIEILPMLTEQELKDLAQRQAMAAGTAD